MPAARPFLDRVLVEIKARICETISVMDGDRTTRRSDSSTNLWGCLKTTASGS